MKVSVDRDTCTGCNLCVDTCPDVFEIDGDTARAKNAAVPAGQEETVRQAAADCPVEAIRVEE